MKKTCMWSLLCILLGMTSPGMAFSQTETKIEQVSVEIGGNKRPFSFYYPYNYQYYYPRTQYEGRSKSCDWVYTNGFWVYSCK